MKAETKTPSQKEALKIILSQEEEELLQFLAEVIVGVKY